MSAEYEAGLSIIVDAAEVPSAVLPRRERQPLLYDLYLTVASTPAIDNQTMSTATVKSCQLRNEEHPESL